MEQMQVMTPDALMRFLRNADLKELAAKTNIKYGTLKNYAYGQSNVENMPLAMVRTLSTVDVDEDFFHLNGNLLVPPQVFEILRRELGIGSTAEEVLNVELLMDVRKRHEPEGHSYYFFRSLAELAASQVDLTVFSLAPMLDIRFVFCDDVEDTVVFSGSGFTLKDFQRLAPMFSYRDQRRYEVVDGVLVKFKKTLFPGTDKYAAMNTDLVDFSYMRPFDIRTVPVTLRNWLTYLRYLQEEYLMKDPLVGSFDLHIGYAILRGLLQDQPITELARLSLMDLDAIHEHIVDRVDFVGVEASAKAFVIELAYRAWVDFKGIMAERPIEGVLQEEGEND